MLKKHKIACLKRFFFQPVNFQFDLGKCQCFRIKPFISFQKTNVRLSILPMLANVCIFFSLSISSVILNF